MNADPITSPRATLHPMIMIAAIAVTLFSAAGIAAIMGWIPMTRSEEPIAAVTNEVVTAPPAQVLETPPAAPAPQPKAAQAPAPRQMVRAEPAPPRPVASAEPAPIPSVPPVASSAPVVPSPPPAPKPICYDCGTIESVRQVAAPGEGTGFGAIAGAIGGGVLGHQVGSGRGRDVGTVVGAIGGAIAGHQIEKQVRKSSSYEIDVRMDDGSVKTFTQDTAPSWRNGDRVHTQNGVLKEAN